MRKKNASADSDQGGGIKNSNSLVNLI